MAKRIERRNKEEIQFRKGLLRFVISFFIILVAGLISNFAISRYPLKQKLLQSMQVPDQFNLEVTEANFRFAQGLMPVLGLDFKRVQVVESRCPTKRLSAHDVLLVVNPWRLVMGEFKVAWAKVGHLQLDYPKRCPSSPVVGEKKQDEEKSSQPSLKNKSNFKSQIVRDFFREVGTLQDFKKLSYLMVDSFEFRGLQDDGQVAMAEGRLSARFKDQIKVDIRLSGVSLYEHRLPTRAMRLMTTISRDALEVSLESGVREGKINFDLEVQNQEQFPVEASLEVDNVPASSLSQALGREIPISYLWGDCQVQLKGVWASLLQAPLEFTSCGLQGPYGKITLDKVSATLEQVSEVSARAEDLNLDQLIQSKRDLLFAGVLARYGLLEARLEYSKNQILLDGLIKESEFIFSNNQRRDLQKVLKIPFSVHGDAQKWQIEVKQIELDSGQIQGDLQVQVDPQTGSGQGRLRFHKLLLSPRIYKLLIDAEPTELKLYGKFFVEQSKLKDWSAFLLTNELKSEWYQLRNLKVRAKGSENSTYSSGSIESSSGDVRLGTALFRWLDPTLLEKTWDSENLSFKELSVNFLVGLDQAVQWKRGYVRLQSGYQLTSEGRRGADRQLSGWLQWDRPDKKFMKWNYEGVFLEGTWRPDSDWLVKWLEDHPSYLKKHPTIEFTGIPKKGFGTQLNDVSRTALDRFKSVIGGKAKSSKNQ